MGGGYARVALGDSGAILLLFLNNAIFRGEGDAAGAIRLLWVSNLINLILDPCLIFGWGPFPKLGVTGAALAIFTGRSIGMLYQFYRFCGGRSAFVFYAASSASTLASFSACCASR